MKWDFVEKLVKILCEIYHIIKLYKHLDWY